MQIVIIPDKGHELLVPQNELGKIEANILLPLIKRWETSAVFVQFPAFKKGETGTTAKFSEQEGLQKNHTGLCPPSLLLSFKKNFGTILATAYVTLLTVAQVPFIVSYHSDMLSN